jgi:hypothetical protein
MTFQAYLDNIEAKTGKKAAQLCAMARRKRLTKAGEIVSWLKQDFDLGHGHAMAIAHLVLHVETGSTNQIDKLAALFSGAKSKWRKPYDALAARIMKFGPDVKLEPNRTYVNVLRGKKFAILQPSAAERFDIGIKLKGTLPSGRFEPTGTWNQMVTHRVRIGDPKEIDAEVLRWLKRAYDAAL